MPLVSNLVQHQYNGVARNWEYVFIITRVRDKQKPLMTNLWENDKNLRYVYWVWLIIIFPYLCYIAPVDPYWFISVITIHIWTNLNSIRDQSGLHASLLHDLLRINFRSVMAFCSSCHDKLYVWASRVSSLCMRDFFEPGLFISGFCSIQFTEALTGLKNIVHNTGDFVTKGLVPSGFHWIRVRF